MHDLRALVVDDSKVGRLTMLKKLESMGVKADLAESGQEALEYLVQRQPDVIFMDHMMPEMDGFEVTRRIKAAPATRNIPVIIISGNDESMFVEEARAAGALDAIAKPPATDVLEALLASLPIGEVEALAGSAPSPLAVAPAPTASLDMAEVHALLARLVEEAVSPLRDDVMAEIAQRLATESDIRDKTLGDWGKQLEQQAAAMADLKRGLADAESSRQRLLALEHRLPPLEAEAARTQPDLAALRAEIEQHMRQQIATGLAESQAKIGSLESQFESLRQGFQVLQIRMNDHATHAEAMAEAWKNRLSTLEEKMGRISGDLHALGASQAELSELRQRLSEPRMREMIAEALNKLPPPVQAIVEQQATTLPTVSPGLQNEIAEMRSKLKALTTLTAIGGAVLLAVIGALVIWG